MVAVISFQKDVNRQHIDHLRNDIVPEHPSRPFLDQTLCGHLGTTWLRGQLKMLEGFLFLPLMKSHKVWRETFGVQKRSKAGVCGFYR